MSNHSEHHLLLFNLNPIPFQLPIDSIQLASLCLDLKKSHLQQSQRLQNLSLRLWHSHQKLSSIPESNITSSSTSSTLTLLFNSVLSNHPLQPTGALVESTHPNSSHLVPSSHASDLQSTPRSGSPSLHSNQTQLIAPPQIFSIAPTPPINPSSNPNLSTNQHSIPQLPQHPRLLLSPSPPIQTNSILNPPSSSSSCFHSSHHDMIKPSTDLRYSSDSTTPSSMGLKSFATFTSIEAQEDQQLAIPSLGQDKSSSHPKTQSHSSIGFYPSQHRRASSTAALKPKSRPLASVRIHSHASSRSVSPRFVHPIRETQASPSHLIRQPTASSSSPSRHIHLLSQHPSLDPIHPCPLDQSIHPSQHLLQLSSDSVTSTSALPQRLPSTHSAPRTLPNNNYGSSESLASLVSPIIPVTPNNSRVSAPFSVSEAIIPHSLASSHATGISSSFLPSAPPPTPAENGAHLPTTMSAALIKSKPPPQRIPVPPPLTTVLLNPGAGGKKKAKFFIKESEADDDRLPSPPLASNQPAEVRPGGVSTDAHISTPQLTAVGSTTATRTLPEKQNHQLQLGSGGEAEELDGSDSDEWGSEYSDDEGDLDTNVTTGVNKYQQLHKKNEEEYYRQLFAKKHFDQRNRSQDGSEQPPPIRRAGLSMLFHPELNHLQHHPRSNQRIEPASTTVTPVRNQSALELRRQGSSSLTSRRPIEHGSPNPPIARGQRLSLGLLPRPCSLIKSKSSVAVPVLAGHEPPAMVQRSPSSHDAQSSVTRQCRRPPPSGGSIPSSTVAHHHHQVPSEEGRQNHQRHPSRLGGKPENVEYSDDDSDSEQEAGDGSKKKETIEMTEEQARRLGRLVRKSQNLPTSSLSPPPLPTTTEPMVLNTDQIRRPQPIAPPLSPRTTRKNMFANELTESLRRNLIWERQMRAQAFGIMLNDNNNNLNKNNLVGEDEMMNGEIDHLVNRGLIDPLNRATKNSNSNTHLNNKKSSSSSNVHKEYRNFSKGFHRTGW